MKQTSFNRRHTIIAGFCAAAVAAPLLGAYAAYLIGGQPAVYAATPLQAPVAIAATAQPEPTAMVRTLAPTATPLPIAPAIALIPTSQPALRAVAAITPLPAQTPITVPTAAPSAIVHAPESIASAARMLGFVWQDGNVRVGPGADQPIVGAVSNGDLVELIELQGQWWHIRTMATEGWVSETLLIVGDSTRPTPQPQVPSATTAPELPAPTQVVVAAVVPPAISFPATMSNGGNVRSGPGLSHTIIGNFDAGTAVDLLDTKAGWWLIRIGSLQGWMSGTLLKVPAEALKHWNVPAVAAAPPKAPAASNGPVVASPLQASSQSTSLWPTTVVRGLNMLPNVIAPNPRMAADAVGPYLRARTRVLRASGVDYLGRLDDVYRGIAFETSKPGVASMSWHKAGRAIDVAQYFNVKGSQGVIFVRDASAPRYYRVLIRCAKQDGSLGAWYGPKALGARQGYYVDVTTILLDEGFQRIAPEGTVSEAWHYEYRGGLKWSQAMNQLYPASTLRRYFPSIWR